MCEITHCVQRYTAVRSPFRVDCEKKYPSVKYFYTSAAIHAMDKYQVWVSLSFGSQDFQGEGVWGVVGENPGGLRGAGGVLSEASYSFAQINCFLSR